ncbi:MAG: hypothetical protein OXH00_02945 [Candidatus Poribacteria bacterium]|nr:hypothetical protein [Candidatus Poribacteria bacterium]
MIHITDEYIHPTEGCYQIQVLTFERFQGKVSHAHANGNLKAYLRSAEIAALLSEQLGFEMPDTPRFAQERLGEFKIAMHPGDSVILIHVARVSETENTNGNSSTHIDKVICLEFFLYGGGKEAVALHFIHEVAMQETTIQEMWHAVGDVVADFVKENTDEGGQNGGES